MTEWMITLDTPPGVASSEDQLVPFSEAIDVVRGTTGASASLDRESGVLSATFTLDAEGVQEAVDAAVLIFNAALALVLLPHGNIVHIDAEPIEDRKPVYA
jgi:hypothetical protein